VTRLLVDDGRVQGVVAIDLKSGKIEAIIARAVIVCTGGCGRVFLFTTNASIKTGDGMASPTARRAAQGHGVHPVPSDRPPFTGILITEAARAEGGYLINKDGYRYRRTTTWETTPAAGVQVNGAGPRDRLSQAS
jgi:fumarate reductase flavoprotein subunit